MGQPLSVSAIINTKHLVEAVSPCLNSLYAQDYPGIEVILVLNDPTEEAAQAFRAAYPSLTVIPQPADTGFAKGKNAGMRVAGGDICLFLNDASEYVQPDTVRRIVEYFAKDEKLACLCLRMVDREDRLIPKYIPRRDRKVITEDTPGANFVAAACAMRRKAFMEAGGLWEELDPHFGGEPELSYRLLDKGYHILHTPHIRVRCHEARRPRKVSRRLYSGTRNTPWIALRDLPWYSVIGLTFLSWGYFFLIALRDGQLDFFLKGVLHSIRRWPAVYRMRKPIGPQAVRTLWKHSGIILY